MPFWTVQYVYPDQSGQTRISLDRVQAETKDEAIKKAASLAPTEEFMVSVHPESEDQALGTVRHQALTATRESDDVSIYEETDEDNEF